MKIGLHDADGGKFPNLALMKISARHKANGDDVEFVIPLCRYDRIYVSKVFGDEYTTASNLYLQSDDVRFGGTGFAIKIAYGREVYEKRADEDLPPEIEHIYPDYSLYPKLTENTAYGFLTRGCPNNCSFCIVSKKEGMQSRKVADLSEFWRGQKFIKLLDANLLACIDRSDLLQQLIDSRAIVDITQGIDARFITEDVAKMLVNIKTKRLHFAFDFMKNETAIVCGLKTFRKISTKHKSDLIVYMLTNYDTTIEEDLRRVKIIEENGYTPDVRIYRKPTAPQILKDLQRWCNNRIIHGSCNFMNYIPRADGRTIKDLYFNRIKGVALAADILDKRGGG